MKAEGGRLRIETRERRQRNMNKATAVVLTILMFCMLCSAGESVLDIAKSKTLIDFTYEDCKQFIGRKGFKSKEELLQLFYNAYFSGKINNIRVNHKETAKITRVIKTLFPMNHCDSIISFDTTLLLIFDNPQKVIVPGTFGLASLHMSKVLAFNLEPDPNNLAVLKFKIVEGHVRLEISKLLQLFKGSLSNMDGTELFYLADANQKISVLGLNEIIDVGRKNIHMSGDSTAISIDLDNPKLKGKEDLLIKKNEMRFFDILFTLQGTDSIRYNDGPWKRDSLTAMQIRYTINSIRSGYAADSLFPGGLRVSKTAVCQFEQRKMSISTGFNLIK